MVPVGSANVMAIKESSLVILILVIGLVKLPKRVVLYGESLFVSFVVVKGYLKISVLNLPE